MKHLYVDHFSIKGGLDHGTTCQSLDSSETMDQGICIACDRWMNSPDKSHVMLKVPRSETNIWEVCGRNVDGSSRADQTQSIDL